MHQNQFPARAARYRTLTSTAAAVLTAVPLLLGSSLASAETRGYVISWFATATNNPDFAVNCPQTIKEQIARIGKRRIDRAIVDGKEVAPLDYPEALQKEPDLETVVGNYAYGFDLGGAAASKFEDPETHEKVDNQLWRAVGCTANFQFTPPIMPYLEGQAWQSGYADAAPAWTMQISGADLNKDGPVTITLDRALDHLQRDALAGIRSDVTYVVDPSARSHNVLQGEIKDGVLHVTSGDIWMEGSAPWYLEVDMAKTHMRMRSEPGKLMGYWGGYIDWHKWSYMYTSRCVVADCVGQYHSVKKLADYDPDASGQNQKISVTWRVEAVPAFLASVDGKVLAVATSDGLGGKTEQAVAANVTAQPNPGQ